MTDPRQAAIDAIDNYALSVGAAQQSSDQALLHNSDVPFGHNIINGTSGYMQAPLPTAKESGPTCGDRLRGDYGAILAGKVFYPGSLPSAFNPNLEGQITGDFRIVCCSVATTMATLQAYAATLKVPVIVTNNEPDGAAKNTAASKAWRQSAFQATRGSLVKIGACFMEYSLEKNGGWQDSWVDPAYTEVMIWDAYWKAREDPSIKIDRMQAKTAQLGVGEWGLGEFGDDYTAGMDDLDRAGFVTLLHENIRRAKPNFACWFGNVGTTGDHRIIPSRDPLTFAAVKPYYS